MTANTISLPPFEECFDIFEFSEEQISSRALPPLSSDFPNHLSRNTTSDMDLDPLANLFAFNFSGSSLCNSRSECGTFTRVPVNDKPDKHIPESPDIHVSCKVDQSSIAASGSYNCRYQTTPSPPLNVNNYYAQPSPANCSYPSHQVQLSQQPYPSNAIQHNIFSNTNEQNHAPTHPQSHFPAASMSVNLSMNMTMGFMGSDSHAQQIQWGSPATYQTNYSSPAQPSNSCHIYSSPYGSQSPTAYTFTAEFRPSENHVTALPPIEKEFSGICNLKSQTSYASQNHRLLADQQYHRHRYHCHNGFSREAKAPQDAFREVNSSNSSTSNSSLLMSTNLCRICGKTYARPSTLKTHLRTHSGERPYRCGTCNKSFSQAANLTAHIRTHSGEKPFRCPVCDRRFSQSSSVTTHMRTHSGERPYRCCMCKKAFSDSSTLTKHLRIHSGEKPYQCKLCLLRFSQSGNLNRHMRIHSNIS